MNTLGPLLGLLAMRGTGRVLPAGVHLRWSYAVAAGYPKYGFSLYRASLHKADATVVQEFPLYRLPESLRAYTLAGAGVAMPQTLRIFSRFGDLPARGGLLYPGQSLALELMPGLRAFQAVFLAEGPEITVLVTFRDGTTEIKRLQPLPEEMRSFYFSSLKQIKSLAISCSLAWLLDLTLLQEGWETVAPAMLARLALPSDQTEIDRRLAAAGSTEAITYADFGWLKDRLAHPPDSQPPVRQVVEEGSGSGGPRQGQALLNPHNVLTTMAVHPAVAEAAGLYFLDTGNPGQQGYALAGHWMDPDKPNGFFYLGSRDLTFRDIDPFPAPAGLSGQPIAGELQSGRPVPAPAGRSADGVVGIGLHWALPVRTPGTPQNHAVRYRIERTRAGDSESHVKDLMTGQSLEAGVWTSPAFQYLDLGDTQGLNGTYAYRVQGIDLFGRLSDPAETAPLAVHSFTLPPAPRELAAQWQRDTLQVSFAWTSREHGKDPDIDHFNVYADFRQRLPIKAQVRSVFAIGADSLLEIVPDLPGWDDGVDLLGGAVTISGAAYVILGVESRAPLHLRVERVAAAVAGGDACLVTANWRNPATWRRRVAEIPAPALPFSARILSLGSIPDFADEQEAMLAEAPFTGLAGVSAASVWQNDLEFPARPSRSDPRRLLVEQAQDAAGARHWPVPGAVEIYPRLTMNLTGLSLDDLVPGTALRKTFGVGVSATDVPADGSNEGPVTPRVFVRWVSDARPDKAVYAPLPDLTSVAAERADAHGFSTYRLHWDALAGAERYFVFRASEQLVIATDRQRTGRPASDYTAMTLYQLWQLANQVENHRAFERLTPSPWPPLLDSAGQIDYTDRTLPGHASARFFYKVQAFSGTNVPGDYSDVFQPVHCPLARPPEKTGIYQARAEGRQVRVVWPHRRRTILIIMSSTARKPSPWPAMESGGVLSMRSRLGLTRPASLCGSSSPGWISPP